MADPELTTEEQPNAIGYPLAVAQANLEWFLAGTTLPEGKTIGHAVALGEELKKAVPIVMPEPADPEEPAEE